MRQNQLGVKPSDTRKKMSENSGTRNRISIDGIEYESTIKASEILNIPYYSIKWRLNSNDYPNYDDEARKKMSEYNTNKCRISIDGIEYDSLKDASLKLNMSYNIIRNRLNNKKYENYFRL